jgi:hypothetical protein
MSPQDYDDSAVGGYSKPRPDLYTVLLLVAVLALVVGSVFLFLEAADYGPTPTDRPTVQTGFLPVSPAGSLGSGPALALASVRGTCLG